jgi:pSer/pThr/pTyr-binding forkhead associated (FHA) protein
MKAELVPDNGDPPIPITRDVTVVGRRGYCDVVIDDPSLSKRHCVLVKTDGLLVVRDLASTNGTKVKGQRIRWAALLPDDRLTLGGYKVRVYLGPDDAPGPSELAQRAAPERRAAGVGASGPGDDPRGRRATGFAPPSPVETPAFKPSDSWHDDEDEAAATWQKRLGEDVIVELD